jgi:endoglucanase
VRAAWYADLISVFDEYEIGWANWDYKGSFGIVDREGHSTGIAEVMLNSYAPSSSRG